MDRRLRPLECFELKLHLLVCTWCARYLKQIRLLERVLLLKRLLDQSTDESPSSLSFEARQRIAKALDSN